MSKSAPTVRATLSASLVAEFLTANPDVDADDEQAVRSAVRTVLGTKRVSAAEVEEFRALVEAHASDEQNDDEAPASRSVVPMVYKARYKAHQNSCGDELATRLRDYLRDPDTQEVSFVKLHAFAVANDCWVERYHQLNIGQQRMNVGNRLRAKVKKGHQTLWPE